MAKKFLIVGDSGEKTNIALLAQSLRDRLFGISKALSQLEHVSFIVENFYHVSSTESEQDIQWRATCYVEITQRRAHTWDEVYSAINAIYSPYYESVSKSVYSYLVQSQQADLAKLQQNLGENFKSLVQTPIDDVDHYINGGLAKHATNRLMAGFEGIQAVGKLKTLKSMTRSQIRDAAVVDVNSILVNHS